MPFHKVVATQLNLRSTPKVASGNLITTLPNGQQVEDLDQADAPWWKVRTTFQGTILEGFANSKFLEAVATAPAAPTATAIRAVHLGENASARPNSPSAQAYAIGDPAAPHRAAASKAADLGNIINYLDVENGVRYQRKPNSTYCNIYAYDYCYLAKVYLPRVWWTSPALERLARGETVEVRYGETVGELNANSLFSWLVQYGNGFGWHRTFDLNAMQTHANAGGVGVICGIRKELNRSGHIVAVVPETAAQTAARIGGSVVRPLQTQAGARNFRYTNGPTAWWQGAEFREFGFFIVD